MLSKVRFAPFVFGWWGLCGWKDDEDGGWGSRGEREGKEGEGKGREGKGREGKGKGGSLLLVIGCGRKWDSGERVGGKVGREGRGGFVEE